MDFKEDGTWNLQNILDLHKDKPDIMGQVDKAFNILWEDTKLVSDISRRVFLETLLVLLQYCGDFSIQSFVLRSIVTHNDVIEFKEWFASMWFKDMPKVISTFISLKEPLSDEDIANFLIVYNSELAEGYVFSFRCVLLSWNEVPLSPSKKSSSYLHLNCGTRTLRISGVEKTPELIRHELFLLKGSEIRQAFAYIQPAVFGSKIQALSIRTTKGLLTVHPDPLLPDSAWNKIDSFLGYIANVSLENWPDTNYVPSGSHGSMLSECRSVNDVLKDSNGNVVKSYDSQNMDLEHTRYMLGISQSNISSLQVVSSSQDDAVRTPSQMMKTEVAEQVIVNNSEDSDVEICKHLTIKPVGMEDPCSDSSCEKLPVDDPEDLYKSVQQNQSAPNVTVENTSDGDINSQNSGGNAENCPESTSGAQRTRNKGRKQFRRKRPTPNLVGHQARRAQLKNLECDAQTAVTAPSVDAQGCPSPAVDEQETSPPRRLTRSSLRLSGSAEDLPEFKMPSTDMLLRKSRGKKRKSDFDKPQITPVDQDEGFGLVESPKLVKSPRPDVSHLPASGTPVKLETDIEIPEDSLSPEAKEPTLVSVTPQESDKEAGEHKKKPMDMPTLLTPCATPQREADDYEAPCDLSSVNDLNDEIPSEEAEREDSVSKPCDILVPAIGPPPPAIPINQMDRKWNKVAAISSGKPNKKQMKLPDDQTCLDARWNTVMEEEKPGDDGSDKRPCSPGAMDSSSDISLLDSADSAVLMPENKQECSTEGLANFSGPIANYVDHLRDKLHESSESSSLNAAVSLAEDHSFSSVEGEGSSSLLPVVHRPFSPPMN